MTFSPSPYLAAITNKMFSKHFYNQIVAFDKFSSLFGVIASHFNPKTRTFYRDPKQEWKVKLNYALLVFWVAASFCIVIKYRRLGEIERFNMTLAYWLTGILAVSLCSVIRLYTKDLTIFGNGFLQFIQYMHSKYI